MEKLTLGQLHLLISVFDNDNTGQQEQDAFDHVSKEYALNHV